MNCGSHRLCYWTLLTQVLKPLRKGDVEIIVVMRSLYQKYELLHNDLSKYNTFYYEGQLYIINVSQSVDLDHALVIDFLHKVSTHGVYAMTVEELFNFIEDVSIDADSVKNYLEEKRQTMSMVYLGILEENISEKHIKRMRNLKSEPEAYNKWNYNKFHLWLIINYDKIIFIDADLRILRILISFLRYLKYQP